MDDLCKRALPIRYIETCLLGDRSTQAGESLFVFEEPPRRPISSVSFEVMVIRIEELGFVGV